MNTENLWGDLPPIANFKTPLQILKEQATAITKMTNGLLVGSVGPAARRIRSFTYELAIRAPALNDYTTNVVTIAYEISLYPVILVPNAAAKALELPTEDAFVAALATTLQDERVRSLIASLLVQSNVAKVE
jgi:hypothetical protein